MLIILEAFDNSIMIIKGFLFAQILIFAGYHDVKTKVIPDFVHIIIALVSIINIKPDQVALGLLVGMLPFLIIGIIFGGIGGGDIKLIGACGLVLGYRGIIVAGIIGLSIALVITLLFQRDKKLGIPLAPYLGVGCFILYLLQI